MEVGTTYNGYDILREMDTFLKELRLSGYKITDFRSIHHDAFLVVHAGERAIAVWLSPEGSHRVYYYDGYLQPGIRWVWHSTEELEDIIMEFVHEHR